MAIIFGQSFAKNRRNTRLASTIQMSDRTASHASRVLVTGSAGQVAKAFLRGRPPDVTILPLSREACDITDFGSVRSVVEAFRPDVVVNLAAYTAVDRAERDSQSAFAVNAIGAGNVARAAKLAGARTIHVSTDYVFGGERSTPYPRNASPSPLNVYGASKFAGEEAIRRESTDALIIRSSWVYSTAGKNFLLDMIDLLRSGSSPRVVTDQRSTPTLAADLADILWASTGRPYVAGTYHFANVGEASWYEFACEIRTLTANEGAATELPEIIPVTSREYNSPAARPRYSVLDSSELLVALGRTARSWQTALLQAVTDLRWKRSKPSPLTTPSC
jgi:dTDP-4-dehydrorhamnose reductase